MNKINEKLEKYFRLTNDVENILDVDSIPHFCIPSLNGYFEKEFVSFNHVRSYFEAYENLPFGASSSLPFGEPALLRVENLNGLDPVTELVNDKEKWVALKNKIIWSNIKVKGRLICNKKSKNKSVKVVSPGILKLAQHLDCDPDPNFCGRYMYNWYYSEGSLNTISHHDRYSLLSTRYSTPGILHVTPINITEEDCIPVDKSKLCLHTDNKQGIFQTIVNNNFIALRQKNFATLFNIKSGRKLKLKKIHNSCEPNDSIVSIAISNKSDGEYCTLTTSHTLKIWSPQTKNECKLSFKFDEDKFCTESCDHWGSVNYVGLSSNYLLFSTRSCVYLKDIRTNLNANLKWWAPRLKYDCNYISLVMKNSNVNTVYVGTRHNVFELDLRKSYTKEWTHMMEHAPLYGTSYPIVEDSETLFLGSQSINEVCLFESNKRVMPYILPSPNDTVRNAKFHGICLDPTITTRCNFSMAGLACIPCKNNKGVYVFRSTSVGDIFYQKVILKDNDFEVSVNCDFNNLGNINWESLSIWDEKCIESIENFSDKPLNVTNVLDKTNTYKLLMDKNVSRKRLLKSIDKGQNEKKKTCVGWWNISKKTLLEEQDPFPQCLLDVWDIDEEEEWFVETKKGKRSNDVTLKEKTDTNSKIESWFSNIQNDTGTPGRNNIQPGVSDYSRIDKSVNSYNQCLFPSVSKTNSPHQNASKDLLNAFAKLPSATPNIAEGSDYDIFDVNDNDFINVGKSSTNYFSPNTTAKKVNRSTAKSKLSSGF